MHYGLGLVGGQGQHAMCERFGVPFEIKGKKQMGCGWSEVKGQKWFASFRVTSEFKGSMLCKLGWGWLEIKGQRWLGLCRKPMAACHARLVVLVVGIHGHHVMMDSGSLFSPKLFPLRGKRELLVRVTGTARAGWS